MFGINLFMLCFNLMSIVLNFIFLINLFLFHFQYYFWLGLWPIGLFLPNFKTHLSPEFRAQTGPKHLGPMAPSLLGPHVLGAHRHATNAWPNSGLPWSSTKMPYPLPFGPFPWKFLEAQWPSRPSHAWHAQLMAHSQSRITTRESFTCKAGASYLHEVM